MEIEEQIKVLLDQGQRKEAIRVLEEHLKVAGDQEKELLLLGELIYRDGDMSGALNKFNAVLRLNPENSKARNYVTMINGILGYYCKDMFNP